MKSGLRVKARVGKIRYTNCLPFYHGLESGDGRAFDLEFYEEVPARINLAMHEDRIDMAPISSLEYLHHGKEYALLPELAIGSRDFSGSVLLISKEKIEGLDGASIALSRESLSSAALLKILFKFKYKFENAFHVSDSDPEEMLRHHKAALIIGDDALFFAPQKFVYQYDLSELWWNWTEKPFCFALWAVRREFAERYPEEVAAFFKKLKGNLERNLADIQTLLKDSLAMDFMDQRFSKVFGYLFNLSYGLDGAMKEGLDLFFRLAKRQGLVAHHKKLDFFKVPS